MLLHHHHHQVLEEVKVSNAMDRDTLISVASTSLRTKLSQQVADVLTEVRMFIVII